MKTFVQFVLAFIITLSIFASCIKDGEYFDSQAQYLKEKSIIEQYAKANLNNPGFHQNSGIWYEIIEPGNSSSYTYTVKDTLNNKVTYTKARIKYVGKLLNGSVFDKFEADTGVMTPVYLNFTTGQTALISAWNLVFIPRNLGGQNFNSVLTTGLQEGTKIRFVTPSLWGYQNASQEKIPANSPLDFTIEVISLTNRFSTTSSGN